MSLLPAGTFSFLRMFRGFHMVRLLLHPIQCHSNHLYGLKQFFIFFLLFHPVIRFIDPHRLFFKIKILKFQSKNFCFCQYKSKKNLLLIRKKHHCFHPVMLLRTILFRLCFFFFVENVIHLPAYLHTTWFINKDFLNNL